MSDLQPQASSLQSDSVADGLFTKNGAFYVSPECSLKMLEETFRNRVIAMLVKKDLLPEERARMLLGWMHSGFNVYHSRRIWSKDRKDLEAVAQYIMRNPFSADKMTVDARTGLVTYRLGKTNIKHKRDYEEFGPLDFIARVTQHPPSPLYAHCYGGQAYR